MKNNEYFKPNLARLGLILLVMIVLFLILIMKLFKVQFIDVGKFLTKESNHDNRIEQIIHPRRGEIFDRNGCPLATNILKYDIGCEPRRIVNKGWFTDVEGDNLQPIINSVATVTASLYETDPDVVKTSTGMAKTICQILGIEDEKFVHNAIQGGSSYRLLARKVDANKAEELRRFKLDGIVFDSISQRNYPEKTLASNLIGWTGIDNQGLGGIESAYNSILAGKNGEYIRLSDSGSSNILTIEPVYNGINLYLTIDNLIQLITEEELERTCTDWNAEGGCCIVADVNTGEVLAMAQYPRFDLNNWSTVEEGLRNRNMCIDIGYQPGSVFKGPVVAVGLEEGVVSEETKFYCKGSKIIEGERFSCPLTAHGSQDLLGIINNSCNIGFIDLGQRLGKDKFYKGLKGFGFGDAPDWELGGSSGIFNKPKWATELPAMSFGTSVNTTLLQLARAYATIANEGIMMKPIIVRQTYNPNNGQSVIVEPEPERRVISSNSAKRTLSLLTDNARMYGKNGDDPLVPGYEVAGKTGTSHVWDSKLGKYSDKKLNCSFAGIVPSKPTAERKVVILSMFKNPYKIGATAWGSTVAIPFFKRIAPRVLSQLEISAGNIDSKEDTVEDQ